MYRFRFETIEQIFKLPASSQLVLPIDELYNYILKGGKLDGILAKASDVSDDGNAPIVIAEIPAIIWENDILNVKKKLALLSENGIQHVLCENIGAVDLANEFTLHGGMYLNVLNSVAADSYLSMGFEDVCLSFEMPFNKIRNMTKDGSNLSLVIYGYLPLMKFRACPAMGKEGCKGCTKDKVLSDRKGEKFRIICRNSKYSELLNCVPLYVGDKALPKVDIYTFYFTVESKEECEKVYRMTIEKKSPEFRRTSGLYNRELL